MFQTLRRLGLTLMSLALLLSLFTLSGVLAAAPASGPAAQPSPRPPLTATPGSDGGSGGGGGSGPAGAIVGNVFDLSTGQPGAGLEVKINEMSVRTDDAGNYSLTGQPPGSYLVSLLLPQGFSPAQDPQTVTLAGEETVIVDLRYYSQPAPDATPAALPESGGLIGLVWPAVLMAIGLVLALLGGWGKRYTSSTTGKTIGRRRVRW